MGRGAGHRPVLCEEVVSLLSAAGATVLLDCTVGPGGHAEALLAAAPDARLIGIDVDESNLELAGRRLARFSPRVRLVRANFADADAVLAEAGVSAADAVVADLGVSSNQLDDPGRGLSFAADGPLDMRLDLRIERTAADLVNDLPEAALADLIYMLGEERYSRRIGRAIVAARKEKRIDRTVELARIVSGAYPRPVRRARRGVHPATRTFQALRLAVNDSLGALERLLASLPALLSVGGRAAIISFQSLEDRRVKRAFGGWAGAGGARLLTKKPITPTREEVTDNPRSRSAKLRGAERVR